MNALNLLKKNKKTKIIYQENTQTLHKHKTQHKCAAPCVAATAAWYVLFWEEQREAVQFFKNRTKENKGWNDFNKS